MAISTATSDGFTDGRGVRMERWMHENGEIKHERAYTVKFLDRQPLILGNKDDFFWLKQCEDARRGF